MPERYVLREYQALPLEAKIRMTKIRIAEWYRHFGGKVMISFSGGKDSTVLAHLVKQAYPEVPLVFTDTGLEFPELKEFAREQRAVIVRPSMSFSEVISVYGYPIISKEVAEYISYARQILNANGGETAQLTRKPRAFYRRKAFTGDAGRDEYKEQKKSMFNKVKWLALLQETSFKISDKCCNVMKKKPLKDYQHSNDLKPYIGSLASESKARENAWIRHGCNSFESFNQTSNPLSFWTEQDILLYIKIYKVEIASIYGDIVAVDRDGFEYNQTIGCPFKLKCTGYQRTGCVFCGFGCHLEKGQTRFERLAFTHPKLYEYCFSGGQWVDNPDYIPSAPQKDGEWLNWNPKRVWVPSKKGLGMQKVFDDCNQIYGPNFIRY